MTTLYIILPLTCSCIFSLVFFRWRTISHFSTWHTKDLPVVTQRGMPRLFGSFLKMDIKLDVHSHMQKTWDFMAKEQDALGTHFSHVNPSYIFHISSHLSIDVFVLPAFSYFYFLQLLVSICVICQVASLYFPLNWGCQCVYFVSTVYSLQVLNLSRL